MNELSPTEIRVIIFLVLTALFLTWERLAPLKNVDNNYQREKTNIFMFILGAFTTKLALPIGLFYFEGQSNYQVDIININNTFLTYLCFDFALYWQHRFTHQVNWLWRLHRVHHYDHALTFSTGLRFHPLEIGISALYKLSLCILFKFDPLGILIFETILNSSSLFTHSNIKIPDKIRKVLGFLVFTPNLHHVHHSKLSDEQKSNYGFILTLWDKVFKTFKDEKAITQIELGVKGMQNESSDDFWTQLKSPF